MSKINMVDRLQICWEHAVEIYNTELSNDPKKRLALKGPGLESSQNDIKHIQPCSVESLEVKVEEVLGRVTRVHQDKKRWQRMAETIILVAASYRSVQQDLHVTSFLLGALGSLVEVAATTIETASEIADGLERVVRCLHRCQKILARSEDDDDDESIIRTVSRIYAHVLSYTIRASAYFSATPATRFIKSTSRSTQQKLQRTLNDLDRELSNLHFDELNSARLSNQKRQNDESLKMDKVLELQEQAVADTRGVHDVPISERKLVTIRRWLSPSLVAQDDVPTPTAGTCQWILKHPSYQKWIDSIHHDCLWIQGIPGSGKSVLAKFLAQNRTTPYVLRYSFTSLASSQSGQGTTFALYLLYHLLEIDELVAPTLLEIERLRVWFETSVDCTLEPLLSALDKILPSAQLTLVVDALDECRDISRASDPLMQWLLTLAKCPNLRVVLFSRSHTGLTARLDIRYRIDMTADIINTDIQIYLKNEIQERGLDRLECLILEKAATDSQGMFLWAVLMIGHIESGQTLGDCKRMVQEFPPSLFDAYRRLVDHSSNHLSHGQIDLRYNIFRLLVGTRRVLSLNEVVIALALRADSDIIEEDDKVIHPEKTILEVCKPIVIVMDNQVKFIHLSVKEFMIQEGREGLLNYKQRLALTLADCDEFLALKTLGALTQRQYRLWKYPAKLLREHLLENRIHCFDESNDLYEYACLHWHDHLTELQSPPTAVMELFREFIKGNEFVSWSETVFELKAKSGPSAQVEVRAKLQSWQKGKLEPGLRPRYPIEDYFIASHESLSEELSRVGDDVLLLYLPLSRLGDYYNVGGETRAEWEAAYRYKKQVAEGFERVRGKRDALTLRAQTSLCQEYFWQSRIGEAENILQEVASIQFEVVGTQCPDYYNTLSFLGLSQFYLSKFEKAGSTLKDAAKGLRRLLDVNIKSFIAKLFLGYALEAMGHFDRASHVYEEIWTQWIRITSETHPLSLMVQTARGSLFRKQKLFDDAQRSLIHSLNERKRLFSLESNTTVDSGIQLAVTYRDSGRPGAALLLDELSKSSIFPEDFERHCQITHVRALLAFDEGEYEQPKLSLLSLIAGSTGAQRHRNNRELLWIRITLADVMRSHQEDQLALMLFSELVKPAASSSGWTSELRDEPEPPSQLRVAEDALRLVKVGSRQEADDLLQKHGLQWVRLKDFWILQGGPITDTACMAPPRGPTLE